MTVYDFTVKDGMGQDVSLSRYEGKVLLLVNTATKCGLTPQYTALEELYEKYHDQGLEVLDFPCNQFKNQAPGTDEEISEFCTLNYHTTFPRFAKIDVNGESADPLYVWLKQQAPKDDTTSAFDKMIKLMNRKAQPQDIKWNFGKFLVDRGGNVAGRFSPGYTPDKLESAIEAALEKKPARA
ncbi:glutathione peroxidase [Clostridia bacterium OttesenSCG-928-O13]|nr:glutathione peroxidase [Clostridia bacterium OttesenSCG-928-O13]